MLVDKVEEYRATEDSMRATLLTAQKMASQMVQEAEKEKADLLAAAESEMGARKAALEAEIAAESERLRLAPLLLPICAACAAASWNFSTVYPKSR